MICYVKGLEPIGDKRARGILTKLFERKIESGYTVFYTRNDNPFCRLANAVLIALKNKYPFVNIIVEKKKWKTYYDNCDSVVTYTLLPIDEQGKKVVNLNDFIQYETNDIDKLIDTYAL